MRKQLLYALGVLLALAGTVPGAAQAGAMFYETMIVEDTPSDYASNGALDLVALQLSERFHVNATDSGRPLLQFRLEPRSLGDIDALIGPAVADRAEIEYIVGFTYAGQPVELRALVYITCTVSTDPLAPGTDCSAPATDGTNYLNETSVFLLFDAATLNLQVGSPICNFWAASSTPSNGQVVYHDVAPGDNAGRPAGSQLAPTPGDACYTLAGTYPFISVDDVRPASLRDYWAMGSQRTVVVTYNVTLASGSDEFILRWQLPPGWNAEASLGGTTERGQELHLSRAGPVAPIAFDITSASTSSPTPNHTLVFEAILLNSGGYFTLPVSAVMVPRVFDHPDYAFELLTPGPFSAGDDHTLQVRIQKAGKDLVRDEVTFFFVKDAEERGFLPATYTDNGTYEALASFPDSGDWTVDVRVTGQEPTPHGAFDVDVETEGEGSPGFGALLLLGAASGLVVLRRHLPRS